MDNWYKRAKLEDIPERLQKIFGLGRFQPKTKYRKCPKCGKEKAYAKEMHPDCDGGQNEMVLYCSDCGQVGEL